jgi:hypothetical protein
VKPDGFFNGAFVLFVGAMPSHAQWSTDHGQQRHLYGDE